MQLADMLSLTPARGDLKTRDRAAPYSKFRHNGKRIKVTPQVRRGSLMIVRMHAVRPVGPMPQVLSMLIDNSEQLNVAHAEFEYRKKLKQQALKWASEGAPLFCNAFTPIFPLVLLCTATRRMARTSRPV